MPIQHAWTTAGNTAALGSWGGRGRRSTRGNPIAAPGRAHGALALHSRDLQTRNVGRTRQRDDAVATTGRSAALGHGCRCRCSMLTCGWSWEGHAIATAIRALPALPRFDCSGAGAFKTRYGNEARTAARCPATALPHTVLYTLGAGVELSDLVHQRQERRWDSSAR